MSLTRVALVTLAIVVVVGCGAMYSLLGWLPPIEAMIDR